MAANYDKLIQQMLQAKIGPNYTRGDTVQLTGNGKGRYRVPMGTRGVVIDTSGDQALVDWGVRTEPAYFSDLSYIGTSTTTSGNTYQIYNEEDMAKSNPPKKKSTTVDIVKLESLVLDEAAKVEIIAVLKQHQNHNKLFVEWGLGETIEYGKGMTFMFYGLPGTGKTWGANCIAKAMGRELLVLSAAEIQSSEPGAANRAIKQAFASAKSQDKVLFIDECDSIIANRADLGMVLASEVNTLLTEIEKFEGVAILATNRIEAMDEALERRISLIVEFPFPNQKQRETIWDKLLPKKLPLDKEVTIADLAKVELSGGQIKNVILQAARIALGSESGKVMPEHFKAAIVRIRKSKNLMGSASRYRQGVVQDYAVGTSKRGKHRDIDTKTVCDFLDEDEKDN